MGGNGVLRETQSSGWPQCRVPCGCEAWQKVRLERQVVTQLGTFFTPVTFLPILVILPLELKRISILLTLISCTSTIWHLAHDAWYRLILWIISSYSVVEKES